MAKSRLLAFDILRILSVASIVFIHVAGVWRWDIAQTPVWFGFFYPNAAIIGVSVLILISGAVLEISHPRVTDLSAFWVRRLTRLYPTYWMSMLIGLFAMPFLLVTLTTPQILLEATGFYTWTGHWGGSISPMGWFIGLIVVLYFCFPFFSAAIRRYPWQTLALMAFTEVLLKCYFNAAHLSAFGQMPDRWFPVCNFLEFGLGIWIAQCGLYPKWESPRWIGFLGEFSFYVFLIHYLNICELLAVSVWLYVTVVLLISGLAMLGDEWIQRRIQPLITQSAL
jgi:peptidoglycan/LPS O-acetylase OafA/YrhL